MMDKRLSERVLSSSPSSTVGIADRVTSLRAQGETVYDFSAGRAFEPTPEYVTEEAIRALREGDTHQTMASGTLKYREACARKLVRENHLQVDPEKHIVATMGCKQGLTAALLALVDPGDEVIVEDPCFVSYKQLVSYVGGVPVPVPLLKENRYRWKSEQLLESVTSRTKAIILCTPQNPTGVVHLQEDLEAIAKVARKYDLFVITDEPYERTVWTGREHLNLATLPGMFERTVTLISLTKSFSMGGWRVGFAMADEPVINQMAKLQQHLITSVNSFVQAGAAEAFGKEPEPVVLDTWKEWEHKVKEVNTRLNDMDGLSCQIPEGGFYAWVDVSGLGLNSMDFCEQLLEEKRVAAVPGISFGKQGTAFVRITCVKSWEELDGGLERIAQFCSAKFRLSR